MSDDVVREFLVESNENLDLLDRELVRLEKDPQNRDTLASVFRTIHTIKGTCGFLGFTKLESVAHVGENLLSRLRDGEVALNPEIATALLRMVDAIRQMLQSIEVSGNEGERDDRDLIDTLTRLQKRDSQPVAAATQWNAGGQTEVSTQSHAGGQAEVGTQSNAGAPTGVSTQPNAAQTGVPEPRAEVRQEAPPNPAIEARDEHPHAANEGAAGDGVAASQSHPAARGSVSDASIRVDVGLLDKLMTLVGELVLARNQILQFTNTTEDAGLVAPSQRLNLITTELQESVMKTRMQPIGNIWSKFPRTVRDVAAACGKQIRIEMEGKETELDKTIIESIKDPLTHIVRNSADHGIESPERRIAAGKPVEGELLLRAFHEGGQVIIEVIDDGAGLDGEKIRKKALEKGLITPEQAARMGEREAVNLIFLPGFSTAEKVTNVSGRGVGMDVVKTNIEKIGGIVDVQSKAGVGTTVRMKIPLTLAIIPALIVTTCGDRYAIPQISLLELVRIEGEEVRKSIELIQGVPVYRLRGRLLPLVYLNRELKLEKPASGGSVPAIVNVVVLLADDRQFGLVVDEINDTEEIVVKPLGKQLKGVKTFAGSTIMGDGKVALILDVLGLAQASNVVAESRGRAITDKEPQAAAASGEKQAMLVFQCGMHGRMAMELSLVARLEEFKPEMVEKAGQCQVVQYRGQIMPLIRVAEFLNLRDGEAGPDASQSMQVVVYSEEGRSVGLVVDQIVDIVEERIVPQNPSRRKGLIGSAVIQQRVTDLLDVRGLVRSANPDFFASETVLQER
jgi:two-component system, chemotaxis family, sensor kinase CheA